MGLWAAKQWGREAHGRHTPSMLYIRLSFNVWLLWDTDWALSWSFIQVTRATYIYTHKNSPHQPLHMCITEESDVPLRIVVSINLNANFRKLKRASHVLIQLFPNSRNLGFAFNLLVSKEVKTKKRNKIGRIFSTLHHNKIFQEEGRYGCSNFGKNFVARFARRWSSLMCTRQN